MHSRMMNVVYEIVVRLIETGKTFFEDIDDESGVGHEHRRKTKTFFFLSYGKNFPVVFVDSHK